MYNGSYQVDEHVRLEFETDAEGVVTISQYNDNVLFETVTVVPGQADSMSSIMYDEGGTAVEREIDISNVVVLQNDEVVETRLGVAGTL